MGWVRGRTQRRRKRAGALRLRWMRCSGGMFRARGLYRTTGWWNSANAITAITDYMRVAGETNYVSVLENTFAKAQIAVPKDQQTVDGKEMTGFPGFLNKYYDDEGWW